jgi:hypothetical protein
MVHHDIHPGTISQGSDDNFLASIIFSKHVIPKQCVKNFWMLKQFNSRAENRITEAIWKFSIAIDSNATKLNYYIKLSAI